MKLRNIFALLLLLVVGLQSANAKEAYTVLNGGTLTFYYDNLRSSRTGTTYDLNTGDNNPAWYADGSYANVTKAVFDSSFAEARPTTIRTWFYKMSNLLSITGIEYLNTSEVVDMGWVFYQCSSLTSLDVSHFNTAKVTRMTSMFVGCKELTSLDVSHFNTANVTDMLAMFSECSSLTSLDVSHFNTANVTDMCMMFSECSSLTSLDVSHFNTAKVRNMNEMFYRCTGLAELDLTNFNTSNVTNMRLMFQYCRFTNLNVSHFNTAKVTDMSGMFMGCHYLTNLDLSDFNTSNVTDMTSMFYDSGKLATIYVGGQWSTGKVVNSQNMFKGCNLLVGGKGTTYDASHVDASYAHIDGGTSNPGYLSGTEYDLWIAGIQVTVKNKDNLTELVAELDEEAMERYFEGEMEITFDGNQALTLKNAIIRPETGMYGIQSKLQNLDINLIGENAITATNSLGVYLQKHENEGTITFIGDGSLYITSNSVALRTFRNVVIKDGAKITAESTGDASGMQGRPLSVGGDGPMLTMQGEGTELRAFGGSVGSLTNFKALNLNDGIEIIEPAGATYAENIGVVVGSSYVANQWVVISKSESEPEAYACYTPENTTLTFYYDGWRSSRAGTTYDLNTTVFPAWFNDGTDVNVTQVVFNSSFANVRPTTTSSWFNNMTNLQSIIGLEYLNTSEVTNMSWMFADCESLTSLDVSHFNTGKVANMSYMFRGCALITSLDVSSFNTANVKTMQSMFSDCSALTSLDLSNFNTEKVTNMSTMFWCCDNLKSVDVSSFNTSKVTDMSMMFCSCDALMSLNLSNFNTANVTVMNRMFESCLGLTKLDLSSFNTAKVTNMNWMFWNCQHVETIYVGDDWSTAAVTSSDKMFYYCNRIVGGKGTTYDESHIDASYAHIDGGTSNPGYFSQHVETYNLWIAGTQLTSEICNDVLGDGTVSYNPDTNTLTLNNANISANGTRGIRAISANFMINLIGNNNVDVDGAEGVSLTNRSTTTITFYGGGSLNIKASDVGIATNGQIVFKDGVQIKTESTGSYGMEGSKARGATLYPKLTMQGRETILIAKGSTGAITHFNTLNLSDDIAIQEPSGATFVSNDGILVTDEWVVIANTGFYDGIQDLKANLNGSWYDLQGRKLDKITQPGIYIKNGKKILVK